MDAPVAFALFALLASLLSALELYTSAIVIGCALLCVALNAHVARMQHEVAAKEETQQRARTGQPRRSGRERPALIRPSSLRRVSEEEDTLLYSHQQDSSSVRMPVPRSPWSSWPGAMPARSSASAIARSAQSRDTFHEQLVTRLKAAASNDSVSEPKTASSSCSTSYHTHQSLAGSAAESRRQAATAGEARRTLDDPSRRGAGR